VSQAVEQAPSKY